MSRALLRRPRFMLERWVQRGVFHQLLLMAGLVAVVALLGGALAFALTPTFEHLPEAVWWSFLRLTDPGYLGDDEGTALRVISTTVTVLGYVLFMGSLIAIMTQWLARTIRTLESGITPIAMQNHFVILGWTNRTPEIVKKLLTASGRVRRFFARRGGSGALRVVILSDEVDAERRLELRDSLGPHWNERQVILRSGSSLQREHLERLDLLRAAVVLIPGADFALGGAELSDTRVVKTLLTLDALFTAAPSEDPLPHVVAELFDPNKVPVARSATNVPIEIIAGDRLICRVLAQSLRHPGVTPILLGLLTHKEGNSVYLRSFPELAGSSLRSLSLRFDRAVVLGIVTGQGAAQRVHIHPAEEMMLGEEDSLVLLAERYDHCVPSAKVPSEMPVTSTGPLPVRDQRARRMRLLILGWSHKTPTLLSELLDDDGAETFDITILSMVEVAERARVLDRLALGDQIRVHQAVGDYSVEHDVEALGLRDYDHVVFMASGSMHTSEEADARTVLGLLLVRDLVKGMDKPPNILVELLDPDNARILGESAEAVFVSPLMLSHLLAHVGLRPELNAVFDALMAGGGVGIELRPCADFGLVGSGTTFQQAQHAAADLGCVALGFYTAASRSTPGQPHLNPDRERLFKLGKHDQLIVLEREPTGA